MTDNAPTPPPVDEPPIPVSLLTGFLGSGKTTLLNRLLQHPDMSETAVLINEFGEIGLDHLLVEAIDEDIVVLNDGCLCCSVRGDLVRAMRELFIKRVKGEVPKFGRVLIETTGLADPAPVIHTLMTEPVIAERYQLDGVITTVDAVNGESQLDRHQESVKQAAVADRIVLAKCDLADEATIAKLESGLNRLNPGAPIIRVENGEIEPGELFDAGLYNPETKTLNVQRWLRDEAYLEHDAHDHGHDHHHEHGHDHDHDALDVNRHDSHIGSFCLVYDEPIHWPAFVAWIQHLIANHGEDLLRIKGIVNLVGEDAPVVIHGVQHLFHNPLRLEAWPDQDRRSRIVFITRDLDRAAVESNLDIFQQAAGDAPA